MLWNKLNRAAVPDIDREDKAQRHGETNKDQVKQRPYQTGSPFSGLKIEMAPQKEVLRVCGTDDKKKVPLDHATMSWKKGRQEGSANA